MIKILFICHGNICRSPMAEFIFKDIVSKNKVEDKFYISSAATSREEIICGKGNPVYPPAAEELRKHGISCNGKRAILLKSDDYEKYDMLIGMDSYNIRNMISVFQSKNNDKIYKLMQFANKNTDISDPWYSGNFDITYKDIYEGCIGLYNYCKKKDFII